MKNSHKTYLYIFLIAALYIFAVQINRMERDNETSEAAVNRSQDMESEEAESFFEDRKRVALTFDDGPGEGTEGLLDGLKDRNAKATFFVVGEKVEQYPDTVQRMKDEGHLIGNHTYTHVQMNTLSCEAAIAEVKKTSELIESIVGEGTGYLRPPYGECTKQMKKELDMFIVLWDVDPLDWSIQNEDAVVEKVLRDVKDGDIILMHDGYETSVTAAMEIIDTLKKQGYEFVTVDEIIFE